VKDFSWIRSSIASLTYKAACSYLGVEPTYSEEIRKEEKMGGNVLSPTYEEVRNVWYVDFTSLYPHIFCQFNLLAEKDPKDNPKLWHGNSMFQVRGYYDISKPHPLNMQIQKKLSERIQLKKLDKNNPMIYAIKIFLNGLYGCVRSPIFEKIHTPNAGWDCCWLGQQIQRYVIKRMEEFGFEGIYGDTDSGMFITKDESKNKRDYVRECLTTIVKEINKNVPFPIGTFDINIEKYIKYIMFYFEDSPIIDENGKNLKENGRLIYKPIPKKKSYLYIYDKNEN
jgi:DNA polymerase elongation subunit (family B)